MFTLYNPNYEEGQIDSTHITFWIWIGLTPLIFQYKSVYRVMFAGFLKIPYITDLMSSEYGDDLHFLEMKYSFRYLSFRLRTLLLPAGVWLHHPQLFYRIRSLPNPPFPNQTAGNGRKQSIAIPKLN